MTVARAAAVRWNIRRPRQESRDLVQLSPDGTSDDSASGTRHNGTPVRYRRTAFVADLGGQNAFVCSQKLVHLLADLGGGEISDAPNTAPGLYSKKTNTEAHSNKTEHTERHGPRNNQRHTSTHGNNRKYM